MEQYDKIFVEGLGLNPQDLPNAKYKETEQWDSVGHMTLISMIEEQYGIMLETEDIMDFDSYKKGIEILENKYNIKLQG